MALCGSALTTVGYDPVDRTHPCAELAGTDTLKSFVDRCEKVVHVLLLEGQLRSDGRSCEPVEIDHPARGVGHVAGTCGGLGVKGEPGSLVPNLTIAESHNRMPSTLTGE